MKMETLSPSQIVTLEKKIGSLSIPDWAFEVVLEPQSVEHFYFYKEVSNADSVIQEVDLQKVVGTYHCDYFDKTWLEMVLRLKRDEISDTSVAIQAFENPSRKNDIVTMDKLGDKYLITNGNHRTCLAKFSNQRFVNAFVKEYALDLELLEACNYLSKYFSFDPAQISGSCDFNYPGITVMTTERTDILKFHSFFLNLDVAGIRKLRSRSIIKNGIDNFLFGWIDRLLFHTSESSSKSKKEHQFYSVKWNSNPDKEVLFRLLEAKEGLESRRN